MITSDSQLEPLPVSDRRGEHRLAAWQVALIVLLVLVGHWLGMHWIVTGWLGGETNIVRGQSRVDGSVRNSQPFVAALDDGWRRTAKGWEQINRSSAAKHPPSQHVQLVQIWPAAVAACMVLAMVAFPAESPFAPRK